MAKYARDYIQTEIDNKNHFVPSTLLRDTHEARLFMLTFGVQLVDPNRQEYDPLRCWAQFSSNEYYDYLQKLVDGYQLILTKLKDRNLNLEIRAIPTDRGIVTAIYNTGEETIGFVQTRGHFILMTLSSEKFKELTPAVKCPKNDGLDKPNTCFRRLAGYTHLHELSHVAQKTDDKRYFWGARMEAKPKNFDKFIARLKMYLAEDGTQKAIKSVGVFLTHCDLSLNGPFIIDEDKRFKLVLDQELANDYYLKNGRFFRSICCVS